MKLFLIFSLVPPNEPLSDRRIAYHLCAGPHCASASSARLANPSASRTSASLDTFGASSASFFNARARRQSRPALLGLRGNSSRRRSASAVYWFASNSTSALLLTSTDRAAGLHAANEEPQKKIDATSPARCGVLPTAIVKERDTAVRRRAERDGVRSNVSTWNMVGCAKGVLISLGDIRVGDSCDCLPLGEPTFYMYLTCDTCTPYHR